METYVSERNISLVYSGPRPQYPIITVENYLKWYDVYLVHPSGEVSKIDLYLVERRLGGETVWADHVPNPKAINETARFFGWDIDPISYELIVGRWVTTILHQFEAEV